MCDHVIIVSFSRNCFKYSECFKPRPERRKRSQVGVKLNQHYAVESKGQDPEIQAPVFLSVLISLLLDPERFFSTRDRRKKITGAVVMACERSPVIFFLSSDTPIGNKSLASTDISLSSPPSSSSDSPYSDSS